MKNTLARWIHASPHVSSLPTRAVPAPRWRFAFPAAAPAAHCTFIEYVAAGRRAYTASATPSTSGQADVDPGVQAPPSSRPRATRIIVLDSQLLNKRTARSSGPGGQYVNKVNSKVQLYYPLAALEPDVAEAVRAAFPSYVNKEGEVFVAASVHRSQRENHVDAAQRLEGLVQRAARRALGPAARVFCGIGRPEEVRARALEEERAREQAAASRRTQQERAARKKERARQLAGGKGAAGAAEAAAREEPTPAPAPEAEEEEEEVNGYRLREGIRPRKRRSQRPRRRRRRQPRPSGRGGAGGASLKEAAARIGVTERRLRLAHDALGLQLWPRKR
eukprot:tig00001030_g6479.t1